MIKSNGFLNNLIDSDGFFSIRPLIIGYVYNIVMLTVYGIEWIEKL
jgi:hypothetical protein